MNNEKITCLVEITDSMFPLYNAAVGYSASY